MEEDLILQMGLMLTQLRIARRALEDIERSTAQYGGFAFSSALSAGPSFGTPPLLNGALKVHIVNIGSLAPGGGFGGFLEGLLGGVGRFFGGLFGGIVGGTISSVTLPYMLYLIDNIAQTIDRILTRLGIGTGSRATESGTPTPSDAESTGGSSGANLGDQLSDIRRTVASFTALFQSASGNTEGAAQRSGLPGTPQGERWLTILRSAEGLITGIARVIDGLILLVPILLGSLVLFIQRLDVVKLAVIEMLQFIMRNIFLLRGVILTTVFDTVAAAARLAGNILGILATSVQRILSAVFNMIGHLLDAAVAALRFIATGLQNTIDGMLRWLVGSLGAILTQIGDLRIFRVLTHVIRIIPAVLPPLYELIRGSDSPPLSPGQQRALREASALPIPGPSQSGTPGTVIPGFPNLGEALVPPDRVRELSDVLSQSSSGLSREASGIFRTGTGTLFGLAGELDRAVSQETEFSGTRLERNLRVVVQRSDELAQALSSAQQAARERPETGLETIARAYEQWLSGGGLNTLLGNISQHFSRTSPSEAGTIPQRIVAETTIRPRATVDIQNVTIEIAPPEASDTSDDTTDSGLESILRISDTALASRVIRQLRELRERGEYSSILT